MPSRKYMIITLMVFLLPMSLAIRPAQDAMTLSIHSKQVARDALSYPADPTTNISWSAGTNGVADIQSAFNNARNIENSQLGTSIPVMSLPSQVEWDNMTDGEKALWLINRERIDRGIMPLDNLESNVNGVAQYYANYLLNNNAWGHYEDGNSPWERLENNPAIGVCHDFLSVSENIAVFVTSGNSISLPVERSVFMWLYDDAGSSWGHRHAILWYPYNDNSGPIGLEGFLGIGRANGGPYQGPFTSSWPFAELIVMNVFDPCPTWIYPAPQVTSISRAGANPTNRVSVDFQVSFTGSVMGVDASDFSLTMSGVSGASVSAVSGSGTTYTVSVDTGTGSGTIRLDLVDDDSIQDSAGTPLGGAGAGNGNFTSGEDLRCDPLRAALGCVAAQSGLWKSVELGQERSTSRHDYQLHGFGRAHWDAETFERQVPAGEQHLWRGDIGGECFLHLRGDLPTDGYGGGERDGHDPE